MEGALAGPASAASQCIRCADKLSMSSARPRAARRFETFAAAAAGK